MDRVLLFSIIDIVHVERIGWSLFSVVTNLVFQSLKNNLIACIRFIFKTEDDMVDQKHLTARMI